MLIASRLTIELCSDLCAIRQVKSRSGYQYHNQSYKQHTTPSWQPQRRALAHNHNTAGGSHGLVANLVCVHHPISHQLKSFRGARRAVQEECKLQTCLGDRQRPARRRIQEQHQAIPARIYNLEGEDYLTRPFLLFTTLPPWEDQVKWQTVGSCCQTATPIRVPSSFSNQVSLKISYRLSRKQTITTVGYKVFPLALPTLDRIRRRILPSSLSRRYTTHRCK